jgi:hypothetical protein
MRYFIATLLAFLCWFLAANSDLNLTGIPNPEAARFSIYGFIVLGIIQMVGRAVVASREVPTRICGMRKPELPELVLSESLLVAEVVGLSSTPPRAEDNGKVAEPAELDAKRLSDILND